MDDTEDPMEHFPTTYWSLVARAGDDSTQVERQGLSDLLERYLPALKAHLERKKRIEPGRADDLLQSFVLTKMLEQNMIARAREYRGKFRTFLLTALDRFIIDQYRYECAQKRQPGKKIPLENTPTLPASAEDRGDVFDVAWARQVLAEGAQKMKQWCEQTGKTDIWGVFERRILRPAIYQTEPVAYDQLVEQFGFQSPVQASNALSTAKRMFNRSLRSVIGEYVHDDKQIDSEIGDLRQILSRAGAGL